MSDGGKKKKKVPKYGGGGTPCHICKKSVYAGEALSFEKMIFHRDCFRCSKCQKKLKDNISNARHLKGVIYCLKCFKADGKLAEQGKSNWHKGQHKSTGGSGKYGGGGKVCVSCNKTVYLAEMTMLDKKPYHKKCLRCADCGKKVVNANVFEGKPYCNKCWTSGGYASKQLKIGWKKKGGTGNSNGHSSGSSRYGGGGTPCNYCGKTVFMGETMTYEKIIYHPKCFMCTDCNKKIDPTKVGGVLEKKIKCIGCWKTGNYTQKQTVTHTAAKSTGKTKSSGSSKYGGGSKVCFACGKKVFLAEMVMFEGKPFHARCLVCSDCGVKTSVNKLNFFEERLICKKCWDTKGYVSKQAHTSTKKNTGGKKKKVDSRFRKFGGGGTKCYICGKTVYDAELISFEKKAYHTQCFKCCNCDKKLKSGTACYTKLNDEIKLYCKKCYYEGGHDRAHLNDIKHSEPEPESKPEPEPEVETEPEPEDTSKKVAELEAAVEPKTVENDQDESGESRPELT